MLSRTNGSPYRKLVQGRCRCNGLSDWAVATEIDAKDPNLSSLLILAMAVGAIWGTLTETLWYKSRHDFSTFGAETRAALHRPT